MADDPRRWAARGGILLHTWDDDATAVAFDPATGDTHALAPLAAELLSRLAEGGPATADALVQAIAADLGDAAPADLRTAVGTELERLLACRLLTLAPS